MKAILVLALLAVLGFAVTSCGATKKVVVQVQTSPQPTMKVVVTPTGPVHHRTITVVNTVTVANVKAGTRIKCKGWSGRGVKVPPAGSEANVGGGTAKPNGVPPTSHQMRLNHSENGSLTVVCTSSG